MNPSKVISAALCILLALTLGYLIARKFGPEGAPDHPRMVLRTFVVPTGRAEEIKTALHHIFEDGKDGGRVQVFGNGVLIVKSPDSLQPGIERLIEQASDQKNGTTHSLHFDYWLVRGEPGSRSKAANLTALEPVLATITQAQGPKKFLLLEHLSFNSQERRETFIKGSMSEVKSIAKELDGRIELMTEIKARELGELKIDTQVKPGEYVVLGESAMQPKARQVALGTATAAEEEGSREIYHIIRAEILP